MSLAATAALLWATKAAVFENSRKWPGSIWSLAPGSIFSENSFKFIVYEIPICITDDSSTAQKHALSGLLHKSNPTLDDMVERIRMALAQSWELHSDVMFTGWKRCSQANPGPRVELKIHPTAGNQCEVIGYQKDGPTKCSIKPWGPGYNPDLCIEYNPGSFHAEYKTECAEQYAIHELGHALGFHHEWRHPDRPDTCVTPDAEEGVLPQDEVSTEVCENKKYTVGAHYDMDSIMTYNDDCADVTGVRFGSERLSHIDALVVKKVYRTDDYDSQLSDELRSALKRDISGLKWLYPEFRSELVLPDETQCGPWHAAGLTGVRVGDRQIQIGSRWRIAAMDANHLSIGHDSGWTPQIFRSDGTLHPGQGSEHGWNPFFKITGSSRSLGAPSGVIIGDRAIEIGSTWRIAAVDATHLAIGHSSGNTVQIFRSDGTLHPGPRTDFNPFSRDLGEASEVSSMESFIQIGNFRLGINDFSESQYHLSVGHKGGKTCQIYRADGTLHPGPRTDWNPWRILHDEWDPVIPTSGLSSAGHANATVGLIGGGVAAVALLALLLFAIRASTWAYVSAVFGKASGSTHDLKLAAVTPTVDDRVAAPTPGTPAPPMVAGMGVLLDGTARLRAELAWYKPVRVQLLATTDGESDAPAWSALMVDGVTVPYAEVVRVRMDESELELIVEKDDSQLQHLRMSTRSEFNLWREALYPKISNPTLQGASANASKLSAVHAAQKWLNQAEGAAVPCS